MFDAVDSINKKLNKCCRCGRMPMIKTRPLMYWASCSKCGFSLRYFLNEDAAIKAWNDLSKKIEIDKETNI